MVTTKPKPRAQAHADMHIVSVSLESNTIVLTARSHGRWLYAEARPERIESEVCRAKLEGCMEDMQAGLDAEQKIEREETRKIKRRTLRRSTEDSGYASQVTSAEGEDEDEQAERLQNVTQQSRDSEHLLRRWFLESFRRPCEGLGNGKKASTKDMKEQSLADWYKASVYCYDLEAAAGAKELLTPVLRDDLDQEQIQKSLTPGMKVPKKLQNLSEAPWYDPADLFVLKEEHNIHMSIHPTLVQVRTTGEQYFLKLAEPGFETGVKRELEVLHDLSKQDLYSKGIRAPRLTGLVALPTSPTSKTHILGFLLSLIPQPCKPLLEYMHTSVPASKRIAWADDVEQMVHTLHENGLVWGDAKGENFLVDKDEKVWIIDFGGSHTQGWVDEELEETEAGDEQGTRKIVEGLRDPENALTGSEDEEDSEDGEEERSISGPDDVVEQNEHLKASKDDDSGRIIEPVVPARGGKRGRDDDEDGYVEDESPGKRQKKN